MKHRKSRQVSVVSEKVLKKSGPPSLFRFSMNNSYNISSQFVTYPLELTRKVNTLTHLKPESRLVGYPLINLVFLLRSAREISVHDSQGFFADYIESLTGNSSSSQCTYTLRKGKGKRAGFSSKLGIGFPILVRTFESFVAKSQGWEVRACRKTPVTPTCPSRSCERAHHALNGPRRKKSETSNVGYTK